MLRTIRHAAAGIALGLAIAAPALGQGIGYRVDDSGVTEPGTSKLEAFTAFSGQGSREAQFTLTPGTTLAIIPFLELSVGITRIGLAREADGSGKRLSWTTALEPQLKAELLPIDRHRIGLAAKAGLSWRSTAQRPAPAEDEAGAAFRRTGSVFGLGIVSLQPVEPLTVNLNLGAERNRIDDRTAPLWGVGAVHEVLENTKLIAEASGTDRGRAALQAGIRQTVFGGSLDLDVAFGRNLSDEKATWLTLGAAVRF